MPNAHQTDEAAIREQAYYLWEQGGRPEGRDTEFWMRAVVTVTGKHQLDTLVQPLPVAVKSKGGAERSAKPKASGREKAVPVATKPGSK